MRTGRIAAGVLVEPVDWYNASLEIWNDPLDPINYLALLPFVPAGYRQSKKAIQKGDDLLPATPPVIPTPDDLPKSQMPPLARNTTVAPGGQAFHATTSPQAAQGVLSGIDPKFFNPNARFGKGFYIAEESGTALAELAHDGATATHGIRFSVNTSKLKVLDLTDPAVAAAWGYKGGPISSATQAMGAKAKAQGFNAIRFKSLRGPGNNLSILDDFNDILKPQMVSPAQ